MNAKVEVPEVMRAVQAEVSAGRLEAAQGLLRDLAQAHPDVPEVVFEMGRVSRQLADWTTAKASLARACALRPRELAVWLERAKLFRADKSGAKALIAEARAAGFPAPLQKALALLAEGRLAPIPAASGAAGKDIARARALSQKGDLRGALALLSRHGTQPEALAEQVGCLMRTGQLDAAEKAARALRNHAPFCASAYVLSGRLALRAPSTRMRALAFAAQAGEMAPRAAEVVAWAVETLLLLGATRRARAILTGALASPAKLRLAESRLLLAEGKPASAARLLRDARGGDAQEMLARALSQSGDGAGALAVYDQISTPSRAAKLSWAQLLQSMGRAAEAETVLRALLRDEPDFGMAFRALAYGGKLHPDDPAVRAIEGALAEGLTTDENRRLAQFGLARVAQGAKDLAGEWAHLAAANGATAALFPYDAELDIVDAARLMGPISESLGKVTAQGPKTPAPIFVTGMPRSGTTLIERILAAHPEVTAGGELSVNPRGMDDLLDAMAQGRVPDEGDLCALAEAYGEGVAERMGTVPTRFTDKSIHTFARMGVLHMAMPGARFVVVHRDPRDVALSIWRNHFPDGKQRYSTDLRAIAQHYGVFHRLVEHWRGAMPGAFHEIGYEALLADPEGETRALLAACGLDWDPACLEFHKGTGRVDTLSFAQVRQPLYASSKGGWRVHEAGLAPFVEALAEEGVPLPGAAG